jgi:hypothetical protein
MARHLFEYYALYIVNKIRAVVYCILDDDNGHSLLITAADAAMGPS